ncbi:NINE protein [Cryobacterium sp. TMT2-23]|uniref:NINE protein n=1 Tax=Cryobacterium sp. TMT2-23 TaxID=1259252 RepID=UPI00106A29A5|nr:NINE protein [Cryobacterium sp. TMT2-23]TFD20055.1 NINE protein [Cryobacterium sp. TMT2-23]
MTNTSPPPGWYLDPRDGRLNRWWDGNTWTEHSAPSSPSIAVQTQSAGKSIPIAYLFAILLGGFGAHRFYLGRPVSASILLSIAVVAVVTGAMSDSGTSPLLAVVWIWTIVDLFLIPGMVRSTSTLRA